MLSVQRSQSSRLLRFGSFIGVFVSAFLIMASMMMMMMMNDDGWLVMVVVAVVDERGDIRSEAWSVAR